MMGDQRQTAWQHQIEEFLHYLRFERSCLSKTIETYRRILWRAGHRFFSTALITEWEKCSEPLVRKWIVELRQIPLSPKTLDLYLSAIRSFLKWIFRFNLDHLPKISACVHSRKQRLPKIIGPDQVLHLLDISETNPTALRDRAILELFYSSGLRLSELRALTIDAFSPDGTLLKICGKGDRERWVPVGKRAQQRIQAWWQLRQSMGQLSRHLFVGRNQRPLSVRAIQKRVLYWGLKKLGMHLHPHVLRHTFATHFLGATQDIRAVQECLGHRNLSTTQRYTHLDFEKISEIYDKTHPRQKRARSGSERPQSSTTIG